MTPFGLAVRVLRREHGMSQSELAKKLGVSSAYLSALEHGKRGAPTFDMIQKLIQIFGLIWDDAEALSDTAQLSKPKVTVDTSDLSAEATLLANLLARRIGRLDDRALKAMLAILDTRTSR